MKGIRGFYDLLSSPNIVIQPKVSTLSYDFKTEERRNALAGT